MTRVLHIQKVAGIAGSENHLLALLPALKARGLSPEMLALADRSDRPGPFLARLRAAGVPARALPIAGDAAPLLVPRLARAIRAGRYDVVHTHLIHADLYGVTAARLAGARAVVSTRHNDNRFMRHLPLRLLMAGVTRQCDRVICISERLRAFSQAMEGASAAQIAVVRYGIDPAALAVRDGSWRAALGIPADAPVVGIVARLIPQKGHSTLLEALPAVARRFPAVRLAVVGDGPLRPQLAALAGRLGVAGRVHFLGWRPDAAALMAGFDLFAHPSRWEGFGLVFLEAMAAGLPVVATRVSAIPEVVEHGRTGLLVPPDDPPALAAAIERVLADPPLARAMGREGRARLLRHFTVDAMVDQTCAVYAAALARPAAPTASAYQEHRP